MKNNFRVHHQQERFFENLLEIARESSRQQAPSTVCINQSRTFNEIHVNVHAVSPDRPGILRRLFSKLF
ncbi:MAG: hypothetical protein IT233_12570 [Bacteroidia bacterium]|nr:hypothetical protein [Bacteroidia bacterium]